LVIIILSQFLEGGFVNQLEDMEEEFDVNSYTQQWLETCEMNNGTQASEDIQVNKICNYRGSHTQLDVWLLQTALSTLTQCVTSRINVFDIVERIKDATPKGELDEVFTSYCK